VIYFVLKVIEAIFTGRRRLEYSLKNTYEIALKKSVKK